MKDIEGNGDREREGRVAYVGQEKDKISAGGETKG